MVILPNVVLVAKLRFGGIRADGCARNHLSTGHRVGEPALVVVHWKTESRAIKPRLGIETAAILLGVYGRIIARFRIRAAWEFKGVTHAILILITKAIALTVETEKWILT